MLDPDKPREWSWSRGVANVLILDPDGVVRAALIPSGTRPLAEQADVFVNILQRGEEAGRP